MLTQVEYYADVNKKKNMTFVGKLMELERILLSEGRNSEAGRQMLHVFSHL